MQKNHYNSMKRMILIIMIVVPLIPFLSALAIGYHFFTTSLAGSTMASMERIVEDHRQMIESFLVECKSSLELIALSNDFSYLSDQANLKEVFGHLRQVSDAFVDLGVFDEDGLHKAYQGPYELTGRVYREAEWFVNVREKGYYISDVFEGFRKVPHFVIAIAERGGTGTWVLRATIDTQRFNDLVKGVRIGKTGEAYLLNRYGIFQTERRSGGKLMEKDGDFGEYRIPDQGIETFLGSGGKKEKYLYATTPLKDKQWLLVVRQKKADAFKSLRTAANLILLISVAGGAVIVWVAFQTTERIIRRIRRTDREKETLEDQLIRAQRLAELGEMAAGFAHEINNPLQIMKSEHALITMNLKELKEAGIFSGEEGRVESFKEIEDSFSQIDKQINRCREITQAILKFGRKNEVKVQQIDLSAFIREMIDIIHKKAEVQGIRLLVDIPGDIPLIWGDPGQLQQVFLNLVNNGFDAVTERHGAEGGKLSIDVGKENGNVVIAFNDNGCGIDPENMKKVFSPFFTTKPVGKGTGLGLSVCYGIIRHMGGEMRLVSEKGDGTTFFISLPAASAD